ncbi:MAG: dialkylresorcinol condensing enzyme [Hyphomonadaceae bacterium]|nr:dialkylresorcinol condensing enzyme [Hyphomonadaceae bacterium]
MKKVLIVHYSQTGQLSDIVEAIAAPLRANADIAVDSVAIRPLTAYPFPWPFWRFFNTFPETVYEQADPIEPPAIDPDADYDLVILAYQVWFLSPSLPTIAFLESDAAKRVLKDKPVITVIGCRNMWLMAQEVMKEKLKALGARLIDNVVLTDSAHSAFTFVSTPAWMLTGKRGPFLNGLIPAAGILPHDIEGCARFGVAIADQLPNRPAGADNPMLSGLGAVKVNKDLIDSEKIAKRSFKLWGALLRALGPPSSFFRQLVLFLYVIFLIVLILTVVPLTAILKKLLSPLTRAAVARQRAYFAAPSGE